MKTTILDVTKKLEEMDIFYKLELIKKNSLEFTGIKVCVTKFELMDLQVMFPNFHFINEL